jgi:hypothetical protein
MDNKIKASFVRWRLVAISIPVALTMLVTWLGYGSFAISALLTFLAVGAVVVAEAYLGSDVHERSRLRTTAAVFLQDHGSILLRVGVTLAIIAVASAHRKVPSVPAVHAAVHLIEHVGAILLVFYVVCQQLIERRIEPAAEFMETFLRRILTGFAALYFALWLIGEVGDDFVAYSVTNPTESLVTVATLAVLWVVLRFAAAAVPSQTVSPRAFEPAVGRLVSGRATVRDRRFTAAHEAGHALVYAALGFLPPEVELVVYREPSDHGVLGFMGGIQLPHQSQEKMLTEWRMLVHLAGKVAESTMFGEETLGSVSDHTQWLGRARTYLANHNRGIFYHEPATKLEIEQNERKLVALQEEQLALLRQLFALNKDVFQRLAEALFKAERLGRDQLLPFLLEVKLPEGFPLPFGPLNPLATTWPDHIDPFGPLDPLPSDGRIT